MRILSVAAISLALAALACGGRQPSAPVAAPQPPPAPAEVVDQVTAVVESYRQGHEVRSLDALGGLYEQSADLVVVGQGRSLRGWPPVAEQLGTLFGRLQDARMRLADLRVVALGADGAVATASVTRSYSDGAATVQETGAVTLVLRRLDGAWKIVGEHYSFAPLAQ